MRQTWRWFGPQDKVTLTDARQAGVEGIVTALHHVPTGDIWTPDEIAKRQEAVRTLPGGAPSGLEWEVIESLPISEDIKTQTGDWRTHIENWKTSLDNIAAAGLKVLCYNFMPILDWTRTDLAMPVAHGGTAMSFDLNDFAAFDIHVLARPGAADDFPEAVREEAARRYAAMDDAAQDKLAKNIVAGLPGSAETWTLGDVSARLATYDGIDKEKLRGHMVDFLAEVVPTAEKHGIRLCCHPDDPPWALLGLPRVMSTLEDYQAVLGAVDSPSNGMTLCSGSLGARPDNDLPAIATEIGPKIHFVHLRNVTRQGSGYPVSFFEDEHLDGATDMVALVKALMDEEKRRKAEGRADWLIPMRPDHGQDILTDLGRGAMPGYPAIGRLKGLAELRGVMRALEWM